MPNIIKLKDVTKVYGDKVKTTALEKIDLEIEESSFNAIIGESGSGKSSLLNIIGTLDKQTEGEVYINNKKTSSLNKKELAKLRNETIGFVFQFHYLLPEFTALENVMMPKYIKDNKKTKEDIEYAYELLDIVGLKGKENKPSTDLSGGQQQRVAIARSLMNKPKIILADEPTGNLDSKTTETIYNLLREINKKLKTTFIIITHDRRVAEKADRIIEVEDGKIIMDIKKGA